MSKILIIGDTHLIEKQEGYLDSQIKCLKNLVSSDNYDSVVLLGDVSDSRKPKPAVLLAIRDLFKFIDMPLYVLRGNHDSVSKNDDGVTYLSLFDDMPDKTIVTHTRNVNINGVDFTMIPHYENQVRVAEELSKVPKGSTVLGHFGFYGSYNSFGDLDYNLPIASFRNPTYLGHIHQFQKEGNITVLGTPYSTSFQESGYRPVVGVFDTKLRTLKTIPVDYGPCYLTFKYKELETNKKKIVNSNKYILLRVLLDPSENSSDMVKNIIEEYKVKWVDLKFVAPESNIKEHSPYLGDVPKFSDKLLEEYLKNVDLPYSKKDMMEVYKQIQIDDNQ